MVIVANTMISHYIDVLLAKGIDVFEIYLTLKRVKLKKVHALALIADCKYYVF